MRKPNATNRFLSEDESQLITVASLFSDYFSIDWIQELTGRKATEVLACCEKAAGHGILRRCDIGSFSFDGEKTRLDFQGRLPVSEQENLNRKIASLLIKDLPDSNFKALNLAPHFLAISNNLEGCFWLFQAGKKFSSDFSTEKALACYRKIIDDLAGVHQQDADELFCDAAIEFAKLNTARGDVKTVTSILEEAMFRARTLQNRRYQSMIDMYFAKNKWLQSQYKSAQNHFESAKKLAAELGDETLIRWIANFKTFLFYWQGRFNDVIADYEKSMADVENFPLGRFPLLATMTVGTCYGQIGQVTQGIGMIDSIRRHCLETGDIGLAAHSGICIGAILLDIGHIDDALAHLVPSVEEARKMQPDWTTIQGELILSYAYYLHGENENTLRHIGQFYKLSKQVDVSVRPWPYLMELCWAIEEGLLPTVPDMSIREEVTAMMKGENVFLKGVAYRFEALLQKKDGANNEAVIKALKQSEEFLETSGHVIELSKTRLELSRLYLMQGNREQAFRTAERAFNILTQLNENLIPDDLKPLFNPASAHENRLKDLITISNDISLTANNRDVIGYIISTANRLTGAERGGIFLIENAKHPYSLKLRASKNLTQDQIDFPEFRASIKLMTEVISSGAGKVQDLRIQENPELPDVEIILSSICVPIVAGGRIMGVLYHDNRLLSNAFNPSLLDILSTLSSYAALILENDRLLKENDHLAVRIEQIRSHYEQRPDYPSPGDLEDMIGGSRMIRDVLAQIVEVAGSDTTVLILGETGVGKELAAKAIQARSLRRDKPFITLNCSALSEKLIFSELFGHEKGSFTGADRRHIGRFEKAHQGTLFLDEIGDLPPDMQVRLLRVLETRAFERVGGKETIYSDFRLITATNRNLEQEIGKKNFRSDLFYRINVFPIYIPPLRDRREDIPLLINHFLKIQAYKADKIARPISREEMSGLVEYDWPGNVRELKNCVERYVTSNHIPITQLLNNQYHPASFSRSAPATLADNERRHIEWALKKTGGKIHGPGGAAVLLDIHPNTLAFRIKKLGIRKNR